MDSEKISREPAVLAAAAPPDNEVGPSGTCHSEDSKGEIEAAASSDSNRRVLRKRRRPRAALSSTCGLSGCGARFPDDAQSSKELHYQLHLSRELEKLERLSRRNRRRRRRDGSPVPPSSVMEGSTSLNQHRSQVRSLAVAQIRANRERRRMCRRDTGHLRDGGTTGSSSSTCPRCPVCRDTVHDLDRADSGHMTDCLRRAAASAAAGNPDPDESEASGREDGFEVYTWAGQTRVRATSAANLRGASGFVTVSRGDEDQVLDVEGDEDGDDASQARRGPAQYTEADVIRTDLDERTRCLIQAVVTVKPVDRGPIDVDRNRPGEDDDDQSRAALCNVCLDNYKTPLVSLACWHVHCEQCWLRALGATKLCPQCKAIVQPKDLRRIFL